MNDPEQSDQSPRSQDGIVGAAAMDPAAAPPSVAAGAGKPLPDAALVVPSGAIAVPSTAVAVPSAAVAAPARTRDTVAVVCGQHRVEVTLNLDTRTVVIRSTCAKGIPAHPAHAHAPACACKPEDYAVSATIGTSALWDRYQLKFLLGDGHMMPPEWQRLSNYYAIGHAVQLQHQRLQADWPLAADASRRVIIPVPPTPVPSTPLIRLAADASRRVIIPVPSTPLIPLSASTPPHQENCCSIS
jgi:hypothetical protein